MKKYFTTTIIILFTVMVTRAQQAGKSLPFQIRLEQTEMAGLPALHSFAYATWEGKWLLMGGRVDGLHRRQPWATFNEEGQNKFLYVVDPVKKRVWKKELQGLPAGIAEQLSSTNLEFCQIGDRLILTGGYGYSKTADDHITYPYLSVINVSDMIRAISDGGTVAQSVVQIRDERMAVTGGRLASIGDTLILAGGQRFDGLYNPHGPDHGPGFVQQYTNEIRKFNLDLGSKIPAITYYTAIRDSLLLHRRDYNLVPQVFEGDETGFTMYSGVFQYNEDIPFTSYVDIKSGTYSVNERFKQKLNHYHSAVLPLYDRSVKNMYTVFFGGIAQYYPDPAGKIISNKDVPFTKTISVIMRSKDKTEETYLPVQMPGYLGAAAEFIFMPDVTLYKKDIADLGALQQKEVLIGYIVGGINSSDKNIFWDNTGKESKAFNKVIKVYIKKQGR
ncbi:MAG: T9SS C-terminal target domain-containing protein [Chitinophagaceae bacterium]|nr:T9SS C-terminal target domain-containing protein [Chitinophagaceae bacterium]